jgi:hypothetical protein
MENLPLTINYHVTVTLGTLQTQMPKILPTEIESMRCFNFLNKYY